MLDILETLEFNKMIKNIEDVVLVLGDDKIVLDKSKDEWRGVFKSFKASELRSALIFLYELDLIKDISIKDSKLIIRLKRRK